MPINIIVVSIVKIIYVLFVDETDQDIEQTALRLRDLCATDETRLVITNVKALRLIHLGLMPMWP